MALVILFRPPSEDELEQRKKEPEDQHFCSLLRRRIDKTVLAKVLSLPPLPEAVEGLFFSHFAVESVPFSFLSMHFFQDHSEVQMLMTHLSGADLFQDCMQKHSVSWLHPASDAVY